MIVSDHRSTANFYSAFYLATPKCSLSLWASVCVRVVVCRCLLACGGVQNKGACVCGCQCVSDKRKVPKTDKRSTNNRQSTTSSLQSKYDRHLDTSKLHQQPPYRVRCSVTSNLPQNLSRSPAAFPSSLPNGKPKCATTANQKWQQILWQHKKTTNQISTVIRRVLLPYLSFACSRCFILRFFRFQAQIFDAFPRDHFSEWCAGSQVRPPRLTKETSTF